MEKFNIRVMSKGMAIFLMTIAFVFALAFLTYGIYNIVKYNQLIQNMVGIDGIVIDHKPKDNQSVIFQTNLYAEIVSYIVDGKEYTVTNHIHSENPVSIGDTMRIYYNKDNPSEAICPSSNGIYWFIIIVGLLFTTFGVVGTCARIRYRKNLKQSDFDFTNNTNHTDQF